MNDPEVAVGPTEAATSRVSEVGVPMLPLGAHSYRDSIRGETVEVAAQLRRAALHSLTYLSTGRAPSRIGPSSASPRRSWCKSAMQLF